MRVPHPMMQVHLFKIQTRISMHSEKECSRANCPHCRLASLRSSGRIDRTDDLHNRVERVAQICQEREADALLIAGDIFSKQASVEDMTRSLKRIRELFAPFFA